MTEYLLTITEGVGNRYSSTLKVLVRATDPGYAKYHWHKLQNQNGSVEDGEHLYRNDDIGYWSELESVEALDEDEAIAAEAMDLPRIPGFQELDPI